MSNKNSEYYFLRGGGEMGEMIRAKDWSKTSLGDPVDWPQSLRTMVAVMLDNPFGMYIAWGSEYTQLYNDGYRPILGASKHPQALGISTRETFSEIWHIIESMFDGAMKGKPVGFPDFMLPLNRNGFVEECYFDFSYSPIRKDNGEVGGVLVTVIETTNKKKAEEALKESEARFRAIADDAPVFIFLAGENAEVEYLNKTWREYTGISTNNYKGRAWAEITHIDDIEPATKIYMDGFNKRESCSFENRQKGIDGIYRTILWKANPRFSPNGQFIGMMGVGLDIHERKKSEEKLRESEEQFRTLADNMENLAWLANGEGRIYWYNKRWLEYTGLSLEEMQGWGWQKVHHPDHVERIVEITKKIWQINETFELTFPIRRHDGEYRWFLTRGYPVVNEEGKITRWIGTNTDINEQKKAAEQFRVLADQAPMWVWQTDKEVNVLYANPEVLRFIGIAHYKELTGHIWEQIVHLEDIPLVYISFGEAVSLQQSFSFEFRVQNAITQQYEWFYIKAVPRLESGEFTGFIGTGININQQKLIISELQYGKALLEAHNESSLDGILLVDTKGEMLSSNKRFAEIWNMPQQILDDKDDEAALAFALTQLVNPEQFMERVRWMYANPEERSIDELEFKDGKIIERYGYHVAGADGSYYGCSWMFRDITKLRNNERAIKESEVRFRSLAQTLPQLVWVTDAQGNQEFASSRWKEYSGFEPIGEGEWREIVHPEDYDNINAAWTHSLTTGSIYTFNVRLKSKEGVYRWYLVKGEPVLDAENKIVKWVGSFTDIHEHKTAEEHFRQMAERMPQKVFTADALGNRDYFNQVMLDYTGLPFEELKDWDWKKIIHPEDWPKAKPKWLHSINTGEDYENEVRLLRKDGKYLWHLVRATALKDEKGKPKMWFGSKTDIQEQKTFTQELEEKVIERTTELTKNNIELENRTIQLEEAQQLAHIGSWEWNVVTNKIEWSDELYRIYGLTPQEFEADYENFIKYVYADDREYVNSIVQKAFEDHQPYRFFHMTASADGNVRILSATGKVITDADGNVIRMAGTAQDVTEQKKYEEELKLSEERFFRIFDSNPVPMSLTEIKTNKIKYANNHFYNAFGYNEEELIGRTSEELNLLDPEEYKRVIDLIFGYLQESRSVAEVQALSKEETEELLVKLNQSENMKDFEILYSRKNGEKFPAIVSYEVIRIGTESFTVTSYQDITLRKKAEEKLRIQNDQLEKMNKELESFAYISSHDLQEPLRLIQTFTSRILEEEANNLSDFGKDMFNRMQDLAKRMQTLIQDLLAYSRSTSTERKYEKKSLNDILEEIKEDLKNDIEQKQVTIETGSMCDCDVIPFQFRQLIHNLLSNAIKFSRSAPLPIIKIKSEIVLGAQLNNARLMPERKYCHLQISDNGIGFEQKYSEKIFEVFQRLHGKSEFDGTGIGLSIVKKIVENHNGIITANGELNKGATFDIYIPTT